jgi:DNA-binding transcriptional LysR family regulator
MLDVRRLRLLRDLARHGTIAAVAESVSYTPSAVSQQLAALEREAGVALLRRTGRRVTLTRAGATLVEHAEVVLAALEQASAAMAAAKEGVVGPLRIAAFPTAVRTLLPPALVRLGQRHPGLVLTVHELDPADAPGALRERRVDLALVHNYDHVPVEPDPALTTQPLLDETIYLASKKPTTLGKAKDSDWILASPGTLCHTMTIRACQAAGYSPRARHHADDFVAALALVAAGQGVALVPELAVGERPESIELTPLRTRRHTKIACRRGSEEHPAIAAGIAALKQAAETYDRAGPQ